jgi:hypothetical protein
MQLKNPLLVAWAMEARGRWKRSVALVAALLALVPMGVGFAASHVVISGVLIGLLVGLWVHRGRHVWADRYARGWLGALPVSRRSVTNVVAMRSVIWLAIVLVGFSGAALLAAAVPLFYACWAGALGGGALGWFLPHREAPAPRVAAVFFVAPAETRGDLSALARWPLAYVKLWLQPRSVAPLLVPAALILPMGISGNLAIAVLFVFVVAIYLVMLLLATLRVAREGGQWLRTTPLSFRRFAWATLRNPALKHLQWTAISAVVLIVLGAKAPLVIRCAAGWLIVAAVVSYVAVVRGGRVNG